MKVDPKMAHAAGFPTPGHPDKETTATTNVKCNSVSEMSADELRKYRKRQQQSRPEAKAKRRERDSRPENRARRREREGCPEYLAKRREKEGRPENLAKRREYASQPDVVARRKEQRNCPEANAKRRENRKKKKEDKLKNSKPSFDNCTEQQATNNSATTPQMGGLSGVNVSTTVLTSTAQLVGLADALHSANLQHRKKDDEALDEVVEVQKNITEETIEILTESEQNNWLSENVEMIHATNTDHIRSATKDLLDSTTLMYKTLVEAGQERQRMTMETIRAFARP